MVKAHSLLYAIYICLIVSIICGALLYFSNLYNQLNLHYNLREEMYIHNQSVVNFALGNKITQEEITIDEKSGIHGFYTTKQYGLLTLLTASSILKNDTITSTHFVGSYTSDKTAIHLANFTKSLSYSGIVKLIGENSLPTKYIETSYITNKPNQLIQKGSTSISEIILPKINPEFSKIFKEISTEKVALNEIEKHKDSLYYNSFRNATKEVYVNFVIGNVIFKGNFILRNKDSIYIKKNTVLEDIILMAPKITFEEGFTGNVQAFATQSITLEEKVTLNYPSVICVYNNSLEKSSINIKKDCKITGAVVLFGNSFENIGKNSIEIDSDGLIFGDIYCTGKLDLKSNVFGSVYTNRFFLKTPSSTYDNTISDIEINATKRPNYFIAIPLFEAKKTTYGILKKVL